MSDKQYYINVAKAKLDAAIEEFGDYTLKVTRFVAPFEPICYANLTKRLQEAAAAYIKLLRT